MAAGSGRGNICLEEIGDTPPRLQARLLRVLQQKEIVRVGGTRVIPVDVRVIAVSNRDLRQLVTEGRFRSDLYHRLNVLPPYVPPPRERKEDVAPLVAYFLRARGATMRLGEDAPAGLVRPGFARRVVRGVLCENARAVFGLAGFPPPAEPGGVPVAAVQMRLQLARSPEEYANRVLSFAARVAERGAQLVAFPEDVTTALLGLLPGIDDLVAAGDLGRAVSTLGPGTSVADVFRALAPTAQPVHEAAFSEAARRYALWVVAGSAILPGAAEAMVNVAQVYAPDGSRLGEQVKCPQRQPGGV